MVKIRRMTYMLFSFLLGIHELGLAITPTTILIDFGKVLGEQSTRTVLSKIGFTNIFANIFSNPLRIEEEYMDFLGTIEPYKDGQIIATNDDKILPKIMCDWLQGLKTPQQVKAIVITKINEAKSKIGKRKAKLWLAITDFMFTPAHLASVTVPKNSVIKIIKKCRSKKLYTGQSMHKIYLLTNFDPETFELIKNKKEFKELFKCFDGILVSGMIHVIKPDPQFFHEAFKKFDINPDQQFTVFIDDEYFNIEAAMRLSKRKLRCIQFTGSKDLKRILRHLEVI